ncbi:MAG: glycosyltransferase family 4 protein [Chloroflexota bacterium]
MTRLLFVSIGDIYRASSRFRAYWWAGHLAKKGVECRVIPYYRALPNLKLKPPFDALHRRKLIVQQVYREIVEAVRWADVIVLQEVLLPHWLLNMIGKSGKRLIFDFSDPIHLGHKANPSLPARLLHRYQALPRFRATLETADFAIVENETLVPLAEQYGCQTAVMRGPINTEFFQPRPLNPERDYVNIGWTGSPSTYHHLAPIFPALEQIGRDFPETKLTLVGASPLTRFNYLSCRVVPWQLDKEAESVADFDIGIFYLSPTEWEKARGGGKLLVYMAAGLPILASPTGIGGQIVVDGECGFLATKPAAWYTHLARLIQNPALRHRLGRNSRQHAANCYSHQAYEAQMLSILGLTTS